MSLKDLRKKVFVFDFFNYLCTCKDEWSRRIHVFKHAIRRTVYLPHLQWLVPVLFSTFSKISWISSLLLPAFLAHWA